MSLREDELADPYATSKSSNSPRPIIFYVMLAFKIYDQIEEKYGGSKARKYLKELDECLVETASIDMTRFIQF